MPVDRDHAPWVARVIPRHRGVAFAIATGLPLALVWSMWALAEEHTHKFLFVPILAIAVVSLLYGVTAGVLATVLSAVALLVPALESGTTRLGALDSARIGGFAVVSFLVAWATGSLRQAYRSVARERAAVLEVAEQLRHEKARAERAVVARDEVLAVVSHDLRNPLAVINVTADLLERRCNRVAPNLSRHTQTIQRHALQMNRLISDLVDVARIEAGRLSVHFASASPRQIATDALERHQPVAAAADVALELLGEPAALPAVRCDPERILQALQNLLGNALKVTPPGGRIAISLEAFDGEVRFTVSDTGPGILPDDLPHLFDRFRRGRSPGYEGSGLGLAIVRGIIEAHGGRVWVESPQGQGARFSFTLAVAPAEHPRDDPTPPGAPDRSDRSAGAHGG